MYPVVNFLKFVVQEVLFSTVDISQGSVATNLRCGAIFSDSVIANFLLILTVKKSLEIDEVIKAHKNVCAKFLGHPVEGRNSQRGSGPDITWQQGSVTDHRHSFVSTHYSLCSMPSRRGA